MAIEGLDGRLYFQNPGNSFNEETFECSAENRIGGSTVYGYVRVIVAGQYTFENPGHLASYPTFPPLRFLSLTRAERLGTRLQVTHMCIVYVCVCLKLMT